MTSMSATPSSQLPSLRDDSHPGAELAKTLSAMDASVFYEKPLTLSDANGSGRIVIPKAIAEMYFPILENQSGIQIDATDSMGNVYEFRFRFWINNQSRMYLLEGAAELQKRYNLHVSDVMVFAHKPDKSLVVAGRPLAETDVIKKSVNRRQSTASNAHKREQNRSVSRCSRSAIQKKSRRATGKEMQSTAHHNGFNPFLAPAGNPLLRHREWHRVVDGVFRFLLNSHGSERSAVFVQSGVWTAVLDIKGEMYQAFFGSQNDAITAFNAAGYF